MLDVVAHVKSLDQIEQRTPAWYAARQHMITASDVAAALGSNPYQSSKKLMSNKVLNNSSFSGNFATVHGNKYEDEARFLFGKLYGLDSWEVGLFRHMEHKWLGGSPDGIASDGSLLEIKCPVKRQPTHDIPAYYYPQVQICMECLDIENCYFIQYIPGNIYTDSVIDVKKIPRSREWFADAYPKLDTFWKTVLKCRADPVLMQDFKPPTKRVPKEKPPPKEPVSMFTSDPEDSEVEDSVRPGTP